MVNNIAGKAKAKMIKNLGEKYLEEVYIEGLSEELIDEGNRVCSNILKLIESSDELKDIFNTQLSNQKSNRKKRKN